MKEIICKPATPKKRFLAFIIEILVQLAYVFSLAGVFDEKYGQDGSIGLALLTLLIINVAFMTRSTTLGKLVLNMKVVNRRTGKNLSFLDMLFRESLGKFVSGAFFAIGFIWIMIDNENRAWHDMIFGTMVVEMIPVPEKALDEHDDDYYVQG